MELLLFKKNPDRKPGKPGCGGWEKEKTMINLNYLVDLFIILGYN